MIGDDDLRNCFAMFISVGMIMKYKEVDPKMIWAMADALMEARTVEQDDGIVSIPKRTRK